MAPKAANKAGAGESQAAVEAKFQKAADKLFERSLDLNISQNDTATLVGEVLSLRCKLLELYGVPPDPKYTPGAMVYAPGGLQAAAVQGEVSWVSKLHEALRSALKKPLSKGEVTFNTVAVDETNKSFSSTVSSPHLKAEYSSAGNFPSKKAAEHSAAQAALKEEYPQVYATAHVASVAAVAIGGQKRKTPGSDGTPAEPQNSKTQLSHFMSLLLQRTVTKEDVVYESSGADGAFSATVKLPTYKGKPSFSGTGDSKKSAEMAAAQAAVAKLEPVAQPLVEEAKAKKAAKQKEALEKLKQVQAEKKAAAKAAKTE